MSPGAFAPAVARFLDTATIAAAGIRNVVTRIDSVGDTHLRLPITINDSERDNAWICSPHTTYVRYAAEELERFGHRALTAPLSLLCRGAGVALRGSRIDDAVAVNNWLVTTNCYPEVGATRATAIIDECIRRWPAHAVWFRSLNRRYTADWLDALQRAGCELIPSRQVYLYDEIPRDRRGPADLRRDLRLLDRWRAARSDAQEWSAADFSRAEALYGLLYLEKYSRLNPDYGAAFLECWVRAGLLRLTGYRDAAGELCAIVGTFELAGTITAPIVGYDTALPQSLGLYRLLMAAVFERSLETGQRINLSAGAAEFKRLRGGRGEIEYSAVYVRHLARHRRAGVRALGALTRRIGEPIMRRYRL